MKTITDLIEQCSSATIIKDTVVFPVESDVIYFLKKGKVSVGWDKKNKNSDDIYFECFSINKPSLLLPLALFDDADEKQIFFRFLGDYELLKINIVDFIKTSQENFAIHIAVKSINHWLSLMAEKVNFYQPSNLTKYIVLTNGITQEYKDFCKKILSIFLGGYNKVNAKESKRIEEGIQQDVDLLNSSLNNIYSPLLDKELQVSSKNLTECYISCWGVASNYLNVHNLDLSTAEFKSENFEKNIELISRCANTFYKKINLESKWWDNDYGIFFARLISKDIPIVLFPKKSGGYQYWDPTINQYVKITGKIAQDIDCTAYIIYPALMMKNASFTDIYKYGSTLNSFNTAVIIMIGIFSGITALAVPIATGMIFDSYVPWLMEYELAQIGICLVILTVINVTFKMTQSYLLLRVQTKLNINNMLMIWGRVLQLPIDFFRKYTVGDLQSRIAGFSQIQRIITESLATTFLALFYSIFAMILLFCYSGVLAIFAVSLVIILTLIDFGISLVSLTYQKKQIALAGYLNGVLQQIVQAITKIRACHAEQRVFNFYSSIYGKINTMSYKIGILSNVSAVLGSFFSVFAVLVIYATMGYFLSDQLTMGSFLAFMTAFIALLQAFTALSSEFIKVIAIIPYYKRFAPILTTEPETSFGHTDVGKLTGRITVDKLTFFYPESPQQKILDNVCLEIEPGQTVAIVGHSGSGKSTLLKLLLGFYSSYQGSIYYNNYDIKLLDIYQLRSQLGIVMQSESLMPSDIFSNIIGLSNLTIDDAWRAAQWVGIDEDIKKMPMEMFTMIGDSEAGISHGQKQKLLLARAIIKNPSVLFLDEATSALDNISQNLVMKTVKSLPMTKIIIAQRLSTIKNADYIYVLESGKIVEQGKYDMLINAQGPFSKLAARQII